MNEERSLYIQLYDSLPRDAKEAMFELWMSGRNDSGIWVRYGDVETAVGRIVNAVRHEGRNHAMAERREGWVRWDYFLLYLQEGSVIRAWYMDPDGSLIECSMVRISGNSRCCISTLRDGYWILDWDGCLDDPAYKQQKGVLLNA